MKMIKMMDWPLTIALWFTIIMFVAAPIASVMMAEPEHKFVAWCFAIFIVGVVCVAVVFFVWPLLFVGKGDMRFMKNGCDFCCGSGRTVDMAGMPVKCPNGCGEER